MMKKPYALIFSFALMLSFFTQACDQGCNQEHQDPVLRENPVSSEAYQRELARLSLDADGDMEYYFEEYMSSEGKKFMVVNTFGPDFCGELHLQMGEAQSDGSSGEQIGFKGGEVDGLKFELPAEGYPRLQGFRDIED